MLSSLPEQAEEHPVMRQDYTIYTPPADVMITTIGNWIDQRVTGGYIYGPSRFGKTRTVKAYVQSVLEERFQHMLPLVIWSRPDTKIVETEFWNLLLSATKFHFKTDGKFKKKNLARYLFLEHLKTLARSARGKFIVLIIDEAHAMTLAEWKWLLSLQNDLEIDGYRLTVFSIGSHQLGYQPNYFARTGNAHIAARFFVVFAKFNGIRSISEMEYVLDTYDTDSEWPEKSGISFTQYFAPDYYARGARLSNHAQQLWQAFENLLPRELLAGNKKWVMEIPMLHIATTIERVLRELSNGVDWEAALSPDHLERFINEMGFTNYMRIISTPE